MSAWRLALVLPVACFAQATVAAQGVQMTFEDALARARAQAPSVLIARARIEEARGRLAGARVRYRDNPTIDGSTGPRFLGDRTVTDFDLGVSQVIETGGQRAARIAGADAGIRRETATAADITRLALRDVAIAWLRTLYAQERVALLARAEAIAADVATVATRRYTAGDIAILDVNVALARARAARMSADALRSTSAGQLQRLLGLPAGALPTARGTLRRTPGEDLSALVAAIDNRPDIQALRADIADAEADVRLGRAAGRPEVGIGARLKREEGHSAMIGELTVALPVFSRGQELLATGAARASRMRMEVDATRAAAVAEVEQLYAAYGITQGAVVALEQDALPGLDENDALAQRSFDVGQISLSELLVIRRELFETRLEHLDRLLEAAEAAIAVDAIAGALR